MEYPTTLLVNVMTSEHDPPVHFSYAADFSRNLYACLSAVEFRALKLLLGQEPDVGSKLRGSHNSRGLDYCGCIVYYSYEPFFRSIYMFDIERSEWFGKRVRTWRQRLWNFFR
jgi:hypothetical protein